MVPQEEKKTRGYTDVIHVSQVNKILLTKHCRAELLEATPELHGIKLSEDRIMTSIIRYYLGLKYYEAKSKAEASIERHNK